MQNEYVQKLVKGRFARERRAVLGFVLGMYGERALDYVAEGAKVASNHARFMLRALVRLKIVASRTKHSNKNTQYTVYMVNNSRREELKVET